MLLSKQLACDYCKMAHVGALVGGVNTAMQTQRVCTSQMPQQRGSLASFNLVGQSRSLRSDCRRSIRSRRGATLQACSYNKSFLTSLLLLSGMYNIWFSNV